MSISPSFWSEAAEDSTVVDKGQRSVPFLVSLILHLLLLITIALWPMPDLGSRSLLKILSLSEPPADPPELVQQVHFSPRPSEHLGAQSELGTEAALSQAHFISPVSEIPTPVDLVPSDIGKLEINRTLQVATGWNLNDTVAVRGAVGEGVTGADGAVDRLTHEILLSLEQRDTLVVWLFDRSLSLAQQRDQVLQRFERIYEELGLLEASGNPAFRNGDKPLLTAAISFGSDVKFVTDQPTDDIQLLREKLREIEPDTSGYERVFTAVHAAAQRYRTYRLSSREPPRNVMLIAFTDEAGDDQELLDKTVGYCRRYEMPVYVVGVPAPFGRTETFIKWVDPDPNYDQSPQWAVVSQGPESYLPERVKLRFAGETEQTETRLDSGFGPFALTRLCYETGGIYFTVHPNRNIHRAVSRNETQAYTAHLEHFFDPEVMRRYRPDYTSADEYVRRVQQSPLRSALLKAAQLSWTETLESPQRRFVKRDEAQFAAALTEAQKAAARLEPKLELLYETLKVGLPEREKEISPRWQAGFDLALGRVLAAKVRAQTYNAVLAQAKRGLKFENSENNTWVLEPTDEITAGSQLARQAELAREFLERIVREHPNTPWALLARQELADPLGFKWTETHTPLDPPPRAMPAADNAPPATPQDDQARVLPKPKPRRDPPRL